MPKQTRREAYEDHPTNATRSPENSTQADKKDKGRHTQSPGGSQKEPDESPLRGNGTGHDKTQAQAAKQVNTKKRRRDLAPDLSDIAEDVDGDCDHYHHKPSRKRTKPETLSSRLDDNPDQTIHYETSKSPADRIEDSGGREDVTPATNKKDLPADHRAASKPQATEVKVGVTRRPFGTTKIVLNGNSENSAIEELSSPKKRSRQADPDEAPIHVAPKRARSSQAKSNYDPEVEYVSADANKGRGTKAPVRKRGRGKAPKPSGGEDGPKQ